jgi:sensor histidine kinase YesM
MFRVRTTSEKRTQLHVRNYESLAMLLRNMNKVYINEEWVVKRYMELQKSKDWDQLKDRNDLLVLQLEREIYAENQGVDPATLEKAMVDIETA